MPNSKMEKGKTWVDYYGNKAVRIPKQRYFCWTTVMCALCLLSKADGCPAHCTCRENTGTVTCQSLRERKVPADLPQWATTLVMRGYNITTLLMDSFSPNGTELELVKLSLSGNNIQIIEAYAFLGLARLESLDLSHNRLFYVAAEAFGGLHKLDYLCLNDSSLSSAVSQVSDALATVSLRNLKKLELSGNQLTTGIIAKLDALNLEVLVLTNNSIQTIGEEDVSSLYEHENMRVYLASNPFKCDCELEGFYNWLKNSSQCPDASWLLCSDPDRKKGIPLEKLRREDLYCKNRALETESYVFLSIVLALIGVVFLLVVYLNRKGIKRWLNNIRDACRDQMEVYHYRYEQDSDPRLANVAV